MSASCATDATRPYAYRASAARARSGSVPKQAPPTQPATAYGNRSSSRGARVAPAAARLTAAKRWSAEFMYISSGLRGCALFLLRVAISIMRVRNEPAARFRNFP